jgi:hypothetical protein
MCDIARERAMIETVLGRRLVMLRAGGETDSRALFTAGVGALSEHYATVCPDGCIERKVEEFVARYATMTLSGPGLEASDTHVSG